MVVILTPIVLMVVGIPGLSAMCHWFSVVVDVGMVGLMKQVIFLGFSGPFGNVSHEILVSSQLIRIVAYDN